VARQFGVRRFLCRCAVAALLAMPLHAVEVDKLIEQLGSTDRNQRREATHQLSQLGPAAKAAVPALIKALDDADRQVWANAVAALAALGPEAREATPKLIEALNTNQNGRGRPRDKNQTLFRSANALTQIGEPAKPALLEALKSQDPGQRLGSAKALGGMQAKDAIPALIATLADEETDVRWEASEALALIGADTTAPLLAVLGSPDARVRETSARALGILGQEKAPAAGPALFARLKDEPEGRVRAALLRAIPRLGLPQEQTVPTLIEAFKKDDGDERRAAGDALLLLQPASPVAVPALLKLMAEPAFAERAAGALGRYGGPARSAVPALLAAAEKAQANGAVYTEAIVAIGAPAVPAVLEKIAQLPPAELRPEHWAIRILSTIGLAGLPEIKKAIASPQASVRLATVTALNDLGEDAREARPDVLKLTKDPEPAVRAAILRTLVSFGVKPQATLEVIDASMSDSSPLVRQAAANAAGSLAAAARPLGQRLTTLLDDPDQSVREAAMRAFGKIGANDAVTEKLLARVDDPALRIAATEALGKLAPVKAAPKLNVLYPAADKPLRIAILGALAGAGELGGVTIEAGLKDGDAAIRTAALRAASKAEAKPEDVAPVLIAALDDPDSGLRNAAMDLLARLGERRQEPYLPAVQPLLKLTANVTDQVAALEALRALRVKDLDLLVATMSHPVLETRIWAIERLGRLGAAARPVRDKVAAQSKDRSESIQQAAGRALRSIDK
jgi:HEAT repeat protein